MCEAGLRFQVRRSCREDNNLASSETIVSDFEDTGSPIILVLHQRQDEVDSIYDKGPLHDVSLESGHRHAQNDSRNSRGSEASG